MSLDERKRAAETAYIYPFYPHAVKGLEVESDKKEGERWLSIRTILHIFSGIQW